MTNIQMNWNFFGSDHGKGEHDGAGAIVKRMLTAEQLKPNGVKMQNSHDVVQWLQSQLKDDDVVPCSFVEVPLGAVDRKRKWGCNTFKGTRKTHSILGFSKIDNTQLLCQSLS